MSRDPLRPLVDPARIADLCSGAGLGADGYAAVGLRPHGFDVEEQPDYPYGFDVADVRDLLLDRPRLEPFEALHTSFPCQFATTAGHLRTAQGGTARYGDLLTDGLATLRAKWSDRPWIVENVDDNRKVCRRWGVYHVKGDAIPSGGRTALDEEHGRHVMGSRRLLPWGSLKEGFPPAYTSYVGADLLRVLA